MSFWKDTSASEHCDDVISWLGKHLPLDTMSLLAGNKRQSRELGRFAELILDENMSQVERRIKNYTDSGK